MCDFIPDVMFKTMVYSLIPELALVMALVVMRIIKVIK